MNHRLHITASLLILYSLASYCYSSKPNVLFISIDDLRPQTYSYGHSQMVTPNIDQLATEGYQFNRAYAQVAICGASRTSVLTGLRPDTTGVYNNNTNFRNSVPWVTTLPKHFSNNGYNSIGIGKKYHNGSNDPQTWDVWLGDSGSNWVQPYVDPDNLSIHLDRKAIQGSTGTTHNGPVTECVDTNYNSYVDGKVTDETIQLIADLSNGDQPFFIGVGFAKPHLPFIAPKKYWDYYTVEDLDIPEYRQRGQNTDSFRFSYTYSQELRTYYGVPEMPTGNTHPKNAPSFETTPSVSHDNLEQELIHGYYACVSYADDLVGKLIQALKDNDVYDNTVILLWGDHGWHLGEHNQWTKHTNYEIANRIPLIIKAPQLPGNVSLDSLVEALDIYPTLSDLCGIDLPPHLEGDTLVPLMEGTANLDTDEPSLSQYPRFSGRMGYTIRTENFRYIQWQRNGILEYEELYDHRTDPKENINIASGINNQTEQVLELRTQLNNYLESLETNNESKFTDFLNNNNLTELSSDDDSDGIPNILEYAFNLNPIDNNNDVIVLNNGNRGMMGLPLIQHTNTSESSNLILKYLKKTNTEDLNYIPEFSSDLELWTPGNNQAKSEIINNYWELITLEDTPETGINNKRFGRVRVVYDP